MYCVSSLLLHTYEHNIFRSLLFQGRKHHIGLGIFGCDGFDVFSARKVLLGHHYEKGPVHTVKYRQVPVGTSFSGNAANAELFVNMWSEVRRRGRSLLFDWTVKVDPDTVMFAERLRSQLRKHVLAAQQKPVFLMNCNGGAYYSSSSAVSKRAAHQDLRNATHGQDSDAEAGVDAAEQSATHRRTSDADATEQDAAPRQEDSGDEAPEEVDAENASRLEDGNEEATAQNATHRENGDVEAVTENASHAYFHSKSHLYGALEAFSREAMHVYFSEGSNCQGSQIHKMGEDEYMGMCLSNFGAPETDLDLIADAVCSPCTCEKYAAAYHPYKSVTAWWACWQKALTH